MSNIAEIYRTRFFKFMEDVNKTQTERWNNCHGEFLLVCTAYEELYETLKGIQEEVENARGRHE